MRQTTLSKARAVTLCVIYFCYAVGVASIPLWLLLGLGLAQTLVYAAALAAILLASFNVIVGALLCGWSRGALMTAIAAGFVSTLALVSGARPAIVLASAVVATLATLSLVGMFDQARELRQRWHQLP
jgi:hypothetical protein